MRAVRLDRLGCVDPTPERRVPDPAELALAPDELLELLLDGIVELEPVGIEHLEPVVVGRVVRCRDHDPGGVVAVAREIGEGRRRDHADDVDVDAERGRARGDGRDEHVTRPARVLAHHDRAAGAGEPVRGGPAEGVGEGGLEIDVGDATDAVGAEQA